MTAFVHDPALLAALSIAIKASVVMAAAALGQAVIRRRASAAARHFGWALAILALLMLPALTLLVPIVPVEVGLAPATPAAIGPLADVGEASANSSAPVSEAATVVTAATVPVAGPIPWVMVLALLYGAGAVLFLGRLVAQHAAVTRLARRAVAVEDPAWTGLLRQCVTALGGGPRVRLLRGRERSMPMAVGTRTPAIVLPATADLWDDDRRRAVLLHELAHVGRGDCLTQMLAAAACALYWMHPGVWWIARRLQVERELACDDLVLNAGTRAREYAGHLLELAHTLGSDRAPALGVTMARPRQLEGRMLAVLDAARNRTVPGIGSRLGGAAIALAVVLLLASLHPVAASAEAALPVPEAAIDLSSSAVATPSPAATPAPAVASRRVHSTDQASTAAQPSGRGTWEIRSSRQSGMVQLRLAEGDSSWNSTISLQRLEQLTSLQLSGAGGPVHFALRRDAGTFTFDGTMRDGVGAGMFSFAPNAAFATDLEKRGIGRPTAEEQYALARGDVSFAFLDELTKQRYPRPTISQLVQAGNHGVRLEYLRDMAEAGYRLDSLEALITLRDHGVTPEYARELGEQGFKNIPVDQLRQTRDHGVTGEFVRALREQGYSLTLDQVVNARDHGVTADFVRELGGLGYRNLPLDQVVRLRDHGVTTEYARQMRDLGQKLTADQMINARDHGVTPEFVRDIAALGSHETSIEALIRLRDHGVTPEYAKAIKDLGYDKLEIEDLVGLRDHGVTADKIRRANERAGTKLPLDMIKALANGGMR